MYMKKFSSEIELRGHIIDSLILTKVFDGIMDHGGSFEVLDIKIGKKKKDERYAKLLVIGNNAKNLVKNNLEVICYTIFYGFKARSEKS